MFSMSFLTSLATSALGAAPRRRLRVPSSSVDSSACPALSKSIAPAASAVGWGGAGGRAREGGGGPGPGRRRRGVPGLGEVDRAGGLGDRLEDLRVELGDRAVG